MLNIEIKTKPRDQIRGGGLSHIYIAGDGHIYVSVAELDDVASEFLLVVEALRDVLERLRASAGCNICGSAEHVTVDCPDLEFTL